MADQNRSNGRINGRGRGGRRDFNVNHDILQPNREAKKVARSTEESRDRGGILYFIRLHIPLDKPPHAIMQIPSGLKSRIRHRLDRNIRKRMADEGAQMIGETTKGVITALSVVSAKRCESVMNDVNGSSFRFLLGVL